MRNRYSDDRNVRDMGGRDRDDERRFGGYGGSYGRDHGDFDRDEERDPGMSRYGSGYGWGGRGYGDQGWNGDASFRYGPRGGMLGRGERQERVMHRDFDRDMDRDRSMFGGRGMGMGMGGMGYGGMGGYGRGMMDRGMERGPHYGKGPKGYKRSDERIREEVCEMIARQGEIDASDVEVRVESGTVILSGTVESRMDKRELEQLVDQCHGVDDVRNEIRVRRQPVMNGAGQASMQSPGMQVTQGSGMQGSPPSQVPGGQNGRNARM